MFVKALQFQREDKTEIAIWVSFHETLEGITWKIGDVRYKRPRKRKWESLLFHIRSDFEYTGRNTEERQKYEMQKYIDFAGADKLKEAILKAWEQIKPDIGSIFSDFTESEE